MAWLVTFGPAISPAMRSTFANAESMATAPWPMWNAIATRWFWRRWKITVKYEERFAFYFIKSLFYICQLNNWEIIIHFWCRIHHGQGSAANYETEFWRNKKRREQTHPGPVGMFGSRTARETDRLQRLGLRRPHPQRFLPSQRHRRQCRWISNDPLRFRPISNCSK